MEDPRRAAVMFSGGRDSTTLLYWARQQGYDPHAFFLDIAQPSLTMSRRAAGSSAVRLDVPLHRVDLAARRWAFIDLDGVHPPKDGLAPLDLNPHYVLGRYYDTALVASLGIAIGAETCLVGLNKSDLERLPVIGTSMRHLEAGLNIMLQSTETQPFRVEMPFADLDRASVVKLGVELGVPFEKTWTCHEAGTLPCGRCLGCEDRRASFAEAGLPDPLSDADAAVTR